MMMDVLDIMVVSMVQDPRTSDAPSKPVWTVDYYKQYFNVDTNDVRIERTIGLGIFTADGLVGDTSHAQCRPAEGELSGIGTREPRSLRYVVPYTISPSTISPNTISIRLLLVLHVSPNNDDLKLRLRNSTTT